VFEFFTGQLLLSHSLLSKFCFGTYCLSPRP